jgi:uncharacterized protein (DUF1800 family)
MNRRNFISLNFDDKNDNSQLLEAKTSKLTKSESYHLLRRLGFAPTTDLVDSLVDKLPEDAINMILPTDTAEAIPDSIITKWIDTPDVDPLKEGTVELRFQAEGRLKGRYSEFGDWWLDLMRLESNDLREKITLFWSTVWTIEFTFDTLSLIPPPLIYRNNQTLRKYRLSDYKTITEEMILDGAMLLYQSLNYSTKEAPNENFMRELMELFTMGVGNYSEGDIREGSRALTGWRTAAYAQEPHPNGYHQTYFDRDSHDTDAKTIMNVAIPAIDDASNNEFQVREKEVRGLVNILFDKRGLAIGKFVAEKMYKYFVYSNPGKVDNDFISELAEVFVNSNYSTLEMLKTILKSKLFYSTDIVGAQIKTPPEYIVGLERLLNINYSKAREAVFELEQILYDPPNVGSWAGYRTWVSTKTFPLRVKHGLAMLNAKSDNELIEIIKSFDGFSDVDMLIEEFLMHWLPVEVTQERKNFYVNLLLDGIEKADWAEAINNNNIANGIRALIAAIIKSPDFQLT